MNRPTFCLVLVHVLLAFVGTASARFPDDNAPALPAVFNVKSPSVCSMKPEMASLSTFTPEAETYKLTATYYSLKDDLTTTLMLNNKGAQPIFAVPTVYSLAGVRLNLAPISVPPASYIDVNMQQLLAGQPIEFREGSMKISYEGLKQQLGAQIRMIDEANNLMWSEQFVYTTKFTSSRLENVWWLPYENTKTRLAVSNTSSGIVSVTLSVQGTSPQQTTPVQLSLAPWETRVLDIMRDLVGIENGELERKGGVSITHNGAPGAVLARMFIAKPNKGYSAAVNFIDPEAAVSSKLHGNGLRFRNLDGTLLSPFIVVRNIGSNPSKLNGRIVYTQPNGSVATIDLPQRTVGAGTAKVFDLTSFVNDLPASVTSGGIEIEYDAPKGTIIASVQSVSSDGDDVFQVPLLDPQALPTSAGGFPWKSDGDFRTFVYLKNETDTPKKYTAHLVYPGGGYSLGINELAPHQTVEIDFRKLRDEQTPGDRGELIPLNVDAGQIGWSIHGLQATGISGRSEQVGSSEGIASTYACVNHCGNRLDQVWIEPGSFELSVGDEASLTGIQTELNFYGQQFGPYTSEGVIWESFDTGVATGYGGSVQAIAPGSTSFQGTFQGFIYIDWGGTYCEPFEDNHYALAPVDVLTVTITKADGTALPDPFRVGITANGHDRKQSLKATVSPANQAANITIQVSNKLTKSNQSSPVNGVITFDVVGNSASASQGDSSITAKRSNKTLATKNVSVVIPKKIATPHDTEGIYSPTNRVLDSSTSPAANGLPSGHVLLVTLYCRYLNIVVKDQFDDLIGDIYAGAEITETIGQQTLSINQFLSSNSSYGDYVGTKSGEDIVLSGSPTAQAWPNQPLLPVQSGSETQNIAVQVDGFALNPAIVGRVWTATAPSTVTVSWPN